MISNKKHNELFELYCDTSSKLSIVATALVTSGLINANNVKGLTGEKENLSVNYNNGFRLHNLLDEKQKIEKKETDRLMDISNKIQKAISGLNDADIDKLLDRLLKPKRGRRR